MTEDERVWVKKEFHRCRHWIKAALDEHPIKTHDVEHVLEACLTGNAQIWPTVNSVCVIEIITHPTGIKTLHGWLAGGDLAEIKKTVLQLEKYGKEIGCQAATIQGRRGWLKAFTGYGDAGTTLFKHFI